MVEIILKDEQGGTLRKVVVVYFNNLSWHSNRKNEENHENIPSEFELGAF
jgi:hypothetical protein